jgi:alkylation response protein AidB-like acyl-CoA dehydrogenase
MDNEEWWPTGIFKKMASAGLLGLTVDPKFGGRWNELYASRFSMSSLLGGGTMQWL